MPHPDAGQAWIDWKYCIQLQRKLDPRRDELGEPYMFDAYDFHQIDRGCELVEQGNLIEAARLFELAEHWGERARTGNARLVQGEALLYRGDLYQRQNQIHLAANYYQRAIKLFELLTARHNLGVAWFRYAALCEELLRLEIARECYSRMRAIWIELEEENGRRGNWNRQRRYADEKRLIETQITLVVERLPLVEADIVPALVQQIELAFEVLRANR